MCALQWPKLLNAPLSEVDPELEDIIEHEKNRQWKARMLPYSESKRPCWRRPTWALHGTRPVPCT
jgi:hypothetical protein